MNQRPTGHVEGVVKSFVAAKGFGFIDGADGRSYWFHRDQFSPPLGDVDTLDGALVVFDPTPSPKGYVAKRLSLAREQATEWIISDEFAFVRGDEPRRGRVVAVTSGDISERGAGSPDSVKAALKAAATSFGANALLDFRYEKSTGANGNYRYTVHIFSGSPAVLAEPKMSSDLERVANSEALCAQRKTHLERCYAEHLAELERLRRRALAIKTILLVGAIVVVGALIFR